MSAPKFAWSKFSYPSALAEALRDLGVAVRPVDAHLTQFPRMVLGRGRRIAHLHWLHPLARGWLPGLAAARTATFFTRLSAARAAGIKLVWTAHNLHDHDAVRPRLDAFTTRLVGEFSDAVIAHSEAARDVVVDELGIERARVHVIPHPSYVDVYPRDVTREAARAELGIAADEQVLLFLGMIRPYKGINLLIDAFRDVEGAKLRLRIVGKVVAPADLEPLAARAADDPRVAFSPGFVPNDALQTHFRSADAVVLPYDDVLTSGAAVLAMSFAKPCVAPRRGCLIDVFADSGVFHYEAGSRGALTDAIKRCIGANDSLVARGEANLARAKRWSWPSVAADTLSLYESLF